MPRTRGNKKENRPNDSGVNSLHCFHGKQIKGNALNRETTDYQYCEICLRIAMIVFTFLRSPSITSVRRLCIPLRRLQVAQGAGQTHFLRVTWRERVLAQICPSRSPASGKFWHAMALCTFPNVTKTRRREEIRS